MEKLYFVLLGALLGVAGTLGAWHLQRMYRRREFTRSLRVELSGLQFKLGCASLVARIESDTLTREFLEWFTPIRKATPGAHNAPELEKYAAGFEILDDEKLRVFTLAGR